MMHISSHIPHAFLFSNSLLTSTLPCIFFLHNIINDECFLPNIPCILGSVSPQTHLFTRQYYHSPSVFRCFPPDPRCGPPQWQRRRPFPPPLAPAPSAPRRTSASVLISGDTWLNHSHKVEGGLSQRETRRIRINIYLIILHENVSKQYLLLYVHASFYSYYLNMIEGLLY